MCIGCYGCSRGLPDLAGLAQAFQCRGQTRQVYMVVFAAARRQSWRVLARAFERCSQTRPVYGVTSIESISSPTDCSGQIAMCSKIA